jgi:hypothetical protein
MVLLKYSGSRSAKHDMSYRIWKFVLDKNYLAFAQQERKRPEVRVLRHLPFLLPSSLQCPTGPVNKATHYQQSVSECLRQG